MASKGDSPTSYMTQPTRKIVIKEKNSRDKSSNNGPLPPSISREIIIVENNGDQMQAESVTGSSENLSAPMASPTSSRQDNLIIIEKSGGTNGPSTAETETGTRPKSRDPAEPQSHTVLSRSASPKVSKSKSNTLSPPPAASKQEITTPPRSKSTSYMAAAADSADVEEEENVIQKIKKSLISSTTPRGHKVLPEGCKPKYERYTYIPEVKPIPASAPSWKIPILQNKNKQAIDAFLDKIEIEKIRREKDRIEREKNEAIPAWKKPMMKAIELRKVEDQRKKLEEAQKETHEWEKFQALPPWRQELILRKKEKERVEGLPSWQRELVLKKRVANMKHKYDIGSATQLNGANPSWTNMTLRKTQKS